MHGGIPRLVMAAAMTAALAVTLTAGGSVPRSGTADTPALRSISTRLDGTISTVLIEASEPVAYLTSQPDPLTVLVDLRNVDAGRLGDRPSTAMLAPVAGVVIEGAHECMTTRGVHKRGVSMITSRMLGTFREDARTRAEFLRFVDVGPGR